MGKFSIVFLIIIASCNAQVSLDIKSNMLENQQRSLIEFSKVANIIDSDSESYWAYKYADSLLGSIDVKGKFYFKDLSRIYSAYTYIFYGMSYTRSVYSVGRGDDYSLEELAMSIVHFDGNKKITKHDLVKKELASIYSIINFYKVSRMPKYSKMYNVFVEYTNISEELFQKYPEYKAYKTASLKNKKLYFKTIVNLVIDLYLVNNQGTDKILMKNYFDNLKKQGETLDEIPDSYIEVSHLSDKAFFEYLDICSDVQAEMLKLLTNEIKILAKKNE